MTLIFKYSRFHISNCRLFLPLVLPLLKSRIACNSPMDGDRWSSRLAGYYPPPSSRDFFSSHISTARQLVAPCTQDVVTCIQPKADHCVTRPNWNESSRSHPTKYPCFGSNSPPCATAPASPRVKLAPSAPCVSVKFPTASGSTRTPRLHSKIRSSAVISFHYTPVLALHIFHPLSIGIAKNIGFIYLELKS